MAAGIRDAANKPTASAEARISNRLWPASARSWRSSAQAAATGCSRAWRGCGLHVHWTASVSARRLLRPKSLKSEPEARGPEDHDRASRADGDAIFDFGDSGRAPGGMFGFLPLGPRPDRALQDHLAAVGFDGDAVGVELRIAAKGILDLAPDLGGSDAGLEDNQVADAPDARPAAPRPPRGRAGSSTRRFLRATASRSWRPPLCSRRNTGVRP